MNKARITYRFDPQGRREPKPSAGAELPTESPKVIPLREDEYRSEEIIDVQPLNQFTTDFGAWSSPFDAETERVERMIRDTDLRTRSQPVQPLRTERVSRLERIDRAVPETNVPDIEAEWPEPELKYAADERYDTDTGYYNAEQGYRQGDYARETLGYREARYVRHSHRTPWLKIVASAVGAIATGALFGFLVLSLFSEDAANDTASWWKLGTNSTASTVEEGGNPPLDSTKVLPATAAKDSTAAAGAGGAAATKELAAAAVSLPAATYSFVQSGVFSTAEGAETAITDLRKKGLAAASEKSTDKYYVYAGVALNRNEVLPISSSLQNHLPDVFIKEYSVPAVQKMKWAGKAGSSPEAYFVQGSKLASMIAGLTALHLQGELAAPEEATMSSLRSAHQQWTQAAVSAAEGMTAEHKTISDKMNTAINMAVRTMEEYKKNPSEAYLWQAQGELIKYIIGEKELRTALAVQ
jgi:stage II sporulation protein B